MREIALLRSAARTRPKICRARRNGVTFLELLMAISPPEESSSARAVGRYQLVSCVVSGALGELWRAKIASGPEEGRPVLVRLISRSSAPNAAAVARLTNAGFAAMELRHPKIAAVLDVVVADSEVAIVSEHIAGAPLKAVTAHARTRRAHPTPAVVARVAHDVLDALDAIRAPWGELTLDPQSEDERLLASGIHGGVTPDNLLVASFGETMLLEAGLAGVAMTLPGILDQPEACAYRAPEQIDGTQSVDERADVFTVGVIAWELISGRPLFGSTVLPRPPATTAVVKAIPKPLTLAAQSAALKRKVSSAPIQRLDALPLLKGKITKEFSDWVSRCLERDRAARFQTLREARDGLRALGEAALASTDVVGKWVVASGVTLDLVVDSVHPEPALASDRPTMPPVEERTSRPASGVTDLTVESLMPSDSAPPPEVAPTTASPVEDPPSSGRDVESLPPSSKDSEDAPTLPPAARTVSAPIESAPPSSVDVPTLPPPAARVSDEPPSRDIESIPSSTSPVAPGASREITLMESVAPSSEEPTTVASMADVNRAVRLASGATPSRTGRRIVAAVMGSAAVIAIAVLIRALWPSGGASRDHEHSASSTPRAATSDAPIATQAPPPPAPEPEPSGTLVPDEPSAEPTNPLPAEAAKALPTSAPSPFAVPRPSEPAVRKTSGNPKKAFRPTGI